MRAVKPVKFNQDLASEVLSRLSDGETLKAICSELRMPSQDTVRSWIRAENEARDSWAVEYARARQAQADGFAADIIELADGVDDAANVAAQTAVKNLADDATETEKRRAFFFAKKRSIEGAKLSIDVRKWIAARQNPQRWGDKVTVEHNLGDETRNKLDFNLLSTEQLEKVAELQEQLSQPKPIDVEFSVESDNQDDNSIHKNAQIPDKCEAQGL